MASYKKMYEAAMDEAKRLQEQIQAMSKIDNMCAELSDQDARDFVLQFADRCENRAEVLLLMRVANKLGA
jgi:hypothetical protein